MLPDLIQELRELGLRGSAFRVGWELKTRSGLQGRRHVLREVLPSTRPVDPGPGWTARLPFAEPRAVADAMRGVVPRESLDRLRSDAHAAMNGEKADVRARFSNGMMWPGDPAGGADNNAGCMCSVRFGR